MRARLVLLLLGVCLLAMAQEKLSVQQLVAFIKSSIQLKQPDKKVADYLRKLQMSEKLDDHTIELLQSEGAGPRTVEALHNLRDASDKLPTAAPPPPKPVVAAIPPPSMEDQTRIIEEAREYALNYSKRLPDYICTQVTRRFIDPLGKENWYLADTITTRLSYFEQHEDYKVILVNNRVSNASYEGLGGAISSGEFGSMLRELFTPDARAEFQWLRWGTLRGRRAHVYSYTVEQQHSKWQVTYGHEDKTVERAVPGYHGLVYVDADMPNVVRLTAEAELPDSFPIQQVSDVLDYDFTDIGGRQFLLPLKAQMRMREGRYMIKNDVEFRLYRKFSAEATVSFDTPEPLPEDKLKEEPAAGPKQ